ncbi:sulfate adenylyltransferase subunit CysN [Alteromonas pelagimontana]|uniref:Sulfate adenylyltransferase subunit 1 n=1 Tax=Alteromonas pelagimontana TaxID=1858656 RepID=A0A6M4MA77_9ALTE|nr:sulfate adenylyltransferase subunit CysN [Alteromonas pelagimontana]QJR79879.1 sulfate adenylyltransferase subunit CysN [Alteromonas pelagimontana]
MNSENSLLKEDVLAYLEQHEQKDLLRFLTCGSVDDGKSTLIGRLLHDSKMIYEDQLAAITKDSKKMGTTGEKVDLALLVDGLQSEREQGITIDVAYRYFSTDKRKFIIADTPGHEQYTRNMVTGASTCDLAIVMVDARAGVKTQTRRHSFLASLLGIKHVIVAVNKMDLMDYSEKVYNEIREDYLQFAKNLNIPDIRFVPLSALDGDNVVNKSEHTPWFEGEPLMSLLETIEIAHDSNTEDFRFPVQYVNRPNLDFRGFCGTVVSGEIQPGDQVTALPSMKTSKVKSIVTFDGDLERAYTPQAVTLTLEDEIDISRGDMIVKADNLPLLSTQFKAHMVWMSDEPLMPNKQYSFKFATKTTSGSVAHIEYQIDVNTMEHKGGAHLNLNEIAVVDVKFTQPVACDAYARNRATGAFIVIDRLTNGTVGAGMILDVLARDAQHETPDFSEFELEFNQLVLKHFPHWNALDLSKM